MGSSARAFVRRHTRLQPVPGLANIRLHLADEVLPLWRQTQLATGATEPPLPYWAFAWAGGLALSRYLADETARVAGRRVFDLGSGSGVCAIAAMRSGAAQVTAADIDPFAVAAIELNARANGVRVGVVGHDVLADEPPPVDVVLAGDCWYEADLAARVMPWLRHAAERGALVLLGDPRRRYLPAEALLPLATYAVRTTTELEDMDQKQATVFTLAAG
jgi:predicted nicotinamide N-methyase